MIAAVAIAGGVVAVIAGAAAAMIPGAAMPMIAEIAQAAGSCNANSGAELLQMS